MRFSLKSFPTNLSLFSLTDVIISSSGREGGLLAHTVSYKIGNFILHSMPEGPTKGILIDNFGVALR